jgi:hypothetical protein
MTPQDFIRKWSDSRIKESAAAQSHFNDLCALLGEKTPSRPTRMASGTPLRRAC